MVIFFILCGYVNTAKAINIYSAFVTLVIAIYLFQWLLTLAGITIDFKLPFSYTSSWDYMNGKIMGMNAYPTSMFSEKSHFCEYLIPYVALCLFSDKLIQKSRIKKSIFCSLVIASSVSGNGIVLLFIVWFMYFIFFAKFKNPGHKIIVAILGIILLVSAYFVLLKIPRFNEMFNELFVDNSGAQFENSKADYRIYRGLDIFSKMPLCGKTIGAGYKHMYLFSKKYTIISEFDFSWKTYEYFSAITMVLLYSGFIGAFACLKHFAALFRSKVTVVRGLIIIMLALWFSTEMLFNITHIMYITLIVAVLCQEKKAEDKLTLSN
ncbi:MAG: hypothetical protein IKV97_00125 [Clostridia bacterium]|nr:hypothetical protein [Clostridia bacterium]